MCDCRTPIRLKVTQRVTPNSAESATYVYRGRDGEWRCTNADGTPMSLGYAGVSNPTEARFRLEDCETAEEARDVLASCLSRYLSGPNAGEAVNARRVEIFTNG